MPAHYEIINSYTRRARILPEVLSLTADEQGTLGVMTLVKICGITNAGDARTAADAGADARAPKVDKREHRKGMPVRDNLLE